MISTGDWLKNMMTYFPKKKKKKNKTDIEEKELQ